MPETGHPVDATRYAAFQRALKRLVQSPWIYNRARRVQLLLQYVCHRTDEEEFTALKGVGGPAFPKTVIDVGANGGQAAITFAFLFKTARIVSFEPNPALWDELAFVRRVIGRRFSFERVGLGDRAGRMTLFVPRLNRLPITTRASLSREEAVRKADDLTGRGAAGVAIDQTAVEIARLDDYGFAADIVKIDVEGCEYLVLGGMLETLARHRPLLVCEANEKDPACFDLLRPFGYAVYRYDRRTRRLSSDPAIAARNWFALTAQHREILGLPADA